MYRYCRCIDTSGTIIIYKRGLIKSNIWAILCHCVQRGNPGVRLTASVNKTSNKNYLDGKLSETIVQTLLSKRNSPVTSITLILNKKSFSNLVQSVKWRVLSKERDARHGLMVTIRCFGNIGSRINDRRSRTHNLPSTLSLKNFF